MNAQMAVKDGEVYILEVNPRASRTVPFVAKAIGYPVAKVAARIMAGERLADFPFADRSTGGGHVAVKEAVFPFARFPGVDLLLGPEMKSTGEVMGLDRDFAAAFVKSQIAAGNELPRAGSVFVSVRDRDKPVVVGLARALSGLGFGLVATHGTAAALREAGLPVRDVLKSTRGGRTSWTLSRTGAWRWSSTPARAARRSATATRCGARRSPRGCPTTRRCPARGPWSRPWSGWSAASLQ
jgi:carbamoyl-phosphate synthase large subunit